MPIPSATPQAPPASESAETHALIAQISAEARASGKALTFNPDAPEADGDDGGEGDAAETPPPAPKKPAERATPKKESEDADEDDDQESPAEEAAEEGAEAEDEEQAQGGSGAIDPAAVKAALEAEGGVDMLALAQALGVEVESLNVSPGASKFLRLEKRKADQTLAKAHDLAQRLERDYGDQVKARSAAEQGELQPAIDFIERTFGMTWNELNKMVAGLLQGKPAKDLEKNRELYALRKKEAERAEAEKASAAKQAQEKKVADAKTWIKAQIKGDKLMNPDLDRQLREAGFPPVVDLVFEEMQSGYSQGLTDPKKALEKVRQKLSKQARVLRTAGLVPKAAAPKTPSVSASKPRANAQTGAAGNGRTMNDQELREAVLREAGLWRN